MNECCKDSVKHAASWQFDEGEVECGWCGTYVPVATVSSDLLTVGNWPAPNLFQQVCTSYLDHDPVAKSRINKRTLLNGRLSKTDPSLQVMPRNAWTPSGKVLSIPRIGLGPEPPRHASPARQAVRDWLIEDVFGGPDEPINGDADLVADIISYALEKREQERVWKGNELLVDITNLLDLIADDHPEKWEQISAGKIAVPGPYTGVGWHTEADAVLAVAITGPELDESSICIAQFIEAMPGLLKELQEFLAQPL